MKKLLLLPILFIALASLAQTKLTIQSDSEKCVTVSSLDPAMFGDYYGFAAARFQKGRQFYTVRGLLRFNLSIPQGSFVNWARLSLFGGGDVADSGPNSFLLLRVTSSWDKNKVTWNSQPSTTKRGQMRLPGTNNPLQDYKNINVTNLVQTMVDSPLNSFGFEIKLQNELIDTAAAISFSTPAFNEPHKNPKIVIEYTASGLQPAVTSISVNNEQSAAMTIYPNPCDKVFNCNIKSANPENMTLRVMDMLGRSVYSQPVNSSNLQMRINLPTSSAGTYFVILQDNKNETVVSQEVQVN